MGSPRLRPAAGSRTARPRGRASGGPPGPSLRRPRGGASSAPGPRPSAIGDQGNGAPVLVFRSSYSGPRIPVLVFRSSYSGPRIPVLVFRSLRRPRGGASSAPGPWAEGNGMIGGGMTCPFPKAVAARHAFLKLRSVAAFSIASRKLVMSAVTLVAMS